MLRAYLPSARPAWRREWTAPLVLGLMTILLIRPAVAHAIEVWSTTEEFSFGFLILPIAAAIVVWRRDALRASVGAGSRAGLAIVFASLVCYVLAERVAINALAGISVSPLLWGSAVYLWGWRTARILAFPIGFLIFGLGLFRGLLDSVGFALQGITAVGAATLAQRLGVDVIRDGLMLTSERAAFIVAEPCSGMSSLVSLLALAALWVYAVRGPVTGRVTVLLSVVPLVILANSTRVALVLLTASWFGQDTALGFFHGASSLVLFGIATCGLVAVSQVVGCRPSGLATQP